MSAISSASKWKIPFYTITAGQLLSSLGSSAVQFALIWWLAATTNSPMVLSIAGLASFLPLIFIGPFAGVWVDRLKLKGVLIGADLFIALCAAGFAIVLQFSETTEYLAYAVLFLRGIGSAFHTPAIQKAVPMLVPADQLVRANGISQFIQSGAYMLGPVIGAALYGLLPLSVIMLTDVLGAVLASLSVAIIHIPTPEKTGPAAKPQIWREMKEGAKVLVSMRKIFVLTIAATLCMVAYLPLSSLYPLMSSSHFGGTEWHGGLVELLYALGMMLTSLYFGWRGEVKNQYRMIHFGMLVLGITSLVSGILPGGLQYFWIFAALCMLMGAGGNIYGVPYMARLQQTVAPEAMGRVFSLISSLMGIAMPVGLVIAAPLAEYWGVAFYFLVAGIFTVVVTALSALITARIKE